MEPDGFVKDSKTQWPAGPVAKPESWREVVGDLLSKVSDTGQVWRGQRDAQWGLISSLERAFISGNVPENERATREQRGFSYFRTHAATYLKSPPADTDILDWLVIMQHYGAPTRLLDWTESPFVATYFAYRDMSNNQAEDAALWGFNADIAIWSLQRGYPPLAYPDARDTAPEDGTQREQWVNEINRTVRAHIKSRTNVPLPVPPVEPDARMTAQQTILTVDARLDGRITFPLPAFEGIPYLFKIHLPAKWRAGVLRELALMGITDASLFPDVGGVAGHSSRIIRDGYHHVRSILEGH